MMMNNKEKDSVMRVLQEPEDNETGKTHVLVFPPDFLQNLGWLDTGSSTSSVNSSAHDKYHAKNARKRTTKYGPKTKTAGVKEIMRNEDKANLIESPNNEGNVNLSQYSTDNSKSNYNNTCHQENNTSPSQKNIIPSNIENSVANIPVEKTDKSSNLVTCKLLKQSVLLSPSCLELTNIPYSNNHRNEYLIQNGDTRPVKIDSIVDGQIKAVTNNKKSHIFEAKPDNFELVVPSELINSKNTIAETMELPEHERKEIIINSNNSFGCHNEIGQCKIYKTIGTPVSKSVTSVTAEEALQCTKDQSVNNHMHKENMKATIKLVENIPSIVKPKKRSPNVGIHKDSINFSSRFSSVTKIDPKQYIIKSKSLHLQDSLLGSSPDLNSQEQPKIQENAHLEIENQISEPLCLEHLCCSTALKTENIKNRQVESSSITRDNPTKDKYSEISPPINNGTAAGQFKKILNEETINELACEENIIVNGVNMTDKLSTELTNASQTFIPECNNYVKNVSTICEKHTNDKNKNNEISQLPINVELGVLDKYTIETLNMDNANMTMKENFMSESKQNALKELETKQLQYKVTNHNIETRMNQKDTDEPSTINVELGVLDTYTIETLNIDNANETMKDNFMSESKQNALKELETKQLQYKVTNHNIETRMNQKDTDEPSTNTLINNLQKQVLCNTVCENGTKNINTSSIAKYLKKAIERKSKSLKQYKTNISNIRNYKRYYAGKFQSIVKASDDCDFESKNTSNYENLITYSNEKKRVCREGKVTNEKYMCNLQNQYNYTDGRFTCQELDIDCDISSDAHIIDFSLKSSAMLNDDDVENRFIAPCNGLDNIANSADVKEIIHGVNTPEYEIQNLTNFVIPENRGNEGRIDRTADTNLFAEENVELFQNVLPNENKELLFSKVLADDTLLVKDKYSTENLAISDIYNDVPQLFHDNGFIKFDDPLENTTKNVNKRFSENKLKNTGSTLRNDKQINKNIKLKDQSEALLDTTKIQDTAHPLEIVLSDLKVPEKIYSSKEGNCDYDGLKLSHYQREIETEKLINPCNSTVHEVSIKDIDNVGLSFQEKIQVHVEDDDAVTINSLLLANDNQKQDTTYLPNDCDINGLNDQVPILKAVSSCNDGNLECVKEKKSDIVSLSSDIYKNYTMKGATPVNLCEVNSKNYSVVEESETNSRKSCRYSAKIPHSNEVNNMKVTTKKMKVGVSTKDKKVVKRSGTRSNQRTNKSHRYVVTISPNLLNDNSTSADISTIECTVPTPTVEPLSIKLECECDTSKINYEATDEGSKDIIIKTEFNEIDISYEPPLENSRRISDNVINRNSNINTHDSDKYSISERRSSRGRNSIISSIDNKHTNKSTTTKPSQLHLEDPNFTRHNLLRDKMVKGKVDCLESSIKHSRKTIEPTRKKNMKASVQPLQKALRKNESMLGKSLDSFHDGPIGGSSDVLKCGVCLKTVENNEWIHHCANEHNYLAWIDGQDPINLADAKAVVQHLKKIKQSTSEFVCTICAKKFSSPKWFWNHIKSCTDMEKSATIIIEEEMNDNQNDSVSENITTVNITEEEVIENLNDTTSKLKSTNVTVVCGVCRWEGKEEAWFDHFSEEHNYLSWRTKDPPLDLESEEAIRAHFKFLLKIYSKLRCHKCGAEKKCAKTFLSHSKTCPGMEMRCSPETPKSTSIKKRSHRPVKRRRSSSDSDNITLKKLKESDEPVTCGRCHEQVDSLKWSNHLAKHEYVAWKEGEAPIDLDCLRSVNQHIRDSLELYKVLSCRICEVELTSFGGYQYHIRRCEEKSKQPVSDDHKKRYIRKSDVVLPTAQRPKTDPVKCAVCSKEMPKKQWANHLEEIHYNLAWFEGGVPFDIMDFHTCYIILNDLQKKLKKLECIHCGLTRMSGAGFYAHILVCQKTQEEIEAMKEQCTLCERKILPLYLSHHMSLHRREGSAPRTPAAANAGSPAVTPGGSRRAALAAKANIQRITSELVVSNQSCTICGHVSTKEECDKHRCGAANFKADFSGDESAPETRWESESEESDSDVDSKVSAERSAPPSPLSSDGEPDGDASCRNKKKIREYERLPYRVGQDDHLLRQPFYAEIVKELCESQLTSDILYPEMECNIFEHVAEVDVAPFMPPLTQSCRTAIQKGRSEEYSEWKSYSVFESDVVLGVHTLFLGGPVAALAWAPPLDMLSHAPAPRHLAATCQRDADLYGLHHAGLHAHPSLIQIWCFDDFENQVRPRFALGIAHEHGTVWSVAWCPSGGRGERRLGLLAAACSDGSVYIYAVRHPEQLPHSDKPIYKTKPVLQLQLCSDGHSRQRHQATAVHWSIQKGHSTVCVGYANGTVALFNLNTDSPILKRNDTDGVTILNPYFDTQITNSAITELTIYPSLHGGEHQTALEAWSVGAAVLATGSGAGSPVLLQRRLALAGCVFAPLWPALHPAREDATPLYGVETEWAECEPRARPLILEVPTAVCLHSRRFTFVTRAGQLVLMRNIYPEMRVKKNILCTYEMIPLQINKRAKKKAGDNLEVKLEPFTHQEAAKMYGLGCSNRYRLKMEEMKADRYPLSAMTCAAFCPAAGDANRLACAGSAGIVHVRKL